MTAEENKRMLALSCIVADMKAENVELEQRVQQLAAEYSNVVCQSDAQDKRKNEDSSKQAFVKLRQTEEQCYKLERENKELRFLARGIHSFVKEKNLYIKKDDECPYCRRGITACSTYCMSCGSCLGVLEGVGVICDKRLAEACAVFPSYD